MSRRRDHEKRRTADLARRGRSASDDDNRSAEELLADFRARSNWQRPTAAQKEKQNPGAKARVRSRY